MVSRVQIGQREPAAGPGERGVAGDELPETAAVDVGHACQIHDHLGAFLKDQAFALVVQKLCTIADRQSSAEVEDGEAATGPFVDLHKKIPFIHVLVRRGKSSAGAAAPDSESRHALPPGRVSRQSYGGNEPDAVPD